MPTPLGLGVARQLALPDLSQQKERG